jgi:hypothetical protein
MIVHDYECQECGAINETFIADIRAIPSFVQCADCGADARKIPSLRRTTPVDAAWLSSVREVVDKNPDKPHCQEFLRHPTRGNYHKWMQGEGIRPLEDGEQPETRSEYRSRTQAAKLRRREAVKAMHMERNAINLITNQKGKD